MMELGNKGFFLMGLEELNNSFMVALVNNDENMSNIPINFLANDKKHYMNSTEKTNISQKEAL